MTAAGLPSHELWPYGREPTSNAFFKAPEIERLYSGVTKRTASLSLMAFRNVVYSAGVLVSVSISIIVVLYYLLLPTHKPFIEYGIAFHFLLYNGQID